ncbi:disulfide bond formation protein B [Vibrio marisflavi]|uniref:Disulfide bond formation protein B n=1 Tax=Vibrio marisflavi CECT 7928 TaxID=634439 RepID=A0ABN8E2K2_9VIBR|nr:disulfide bond formation protein B [Vibrio marisflavi]CAH0537377.1 Disulfide bond formation protein B [Vibrio marisflavi CECT 7928]
MTRSQVSILNSLGLLGITIVLFLAFVFQFAWGELPCPLCLLQRVGFGLVMFGFMLNVLYGPQQRHYGVTLLGALFGAGAALRQISLHVIPGTPGYGSAVLGFHYYTWAFILFSATVLGCALLLTMWKEEWNSETVEVSKCGRIICILAIVVVALNLLSTFVECGPYQCPDNPVSYWLMSLL